MTTTRRAVGIAQDRQPPTNAAPTAPTNTQEPPGCHQLLPARDRGAKRDSQQQKLDATGPERLPPAAREAPVTRQRPPPRGSPGLPPPPRPAATRRARRLATGCGMVGAEGRRALRVPWSEGSWLNGALGTVAGQGESCAGNSLRQRRYSFESSKSRTCTVCSSLGCMSSNMLCLSHSPSPVGEHYGIIPVLLLCSTSGMNQEYWVISGG